MGAIMAAKNPLRFIFPFLRILYMEVTPSLIPAFVALIKHESPPTGSEPMQGDALHAVVCNLMKALAEEKPTIWVIEDLHFASSDSRTLLLSMARTVAPLRVLIIATARPGVPEEDLANLSRLEQYQRLPLGRLGAREVIELLRDAFKSEAVADKLGAKIAYKSDGVPFFVFEMIRGLKEGRFLKEQPDGSYIQTQMITDIEVPSAVRDLIEARLSDLSDEDRNLLDVAAVQGFDFDPDLVARVCDMKRVAALQRLAALERRSGVIRSEAGDCRFDHYQLQEMLYRDLMPELRSEYHTLLADAFAEREELDAEDTVGEDAYFLARNYLHGNRPKRALPYLDAALDYLENAYQSDAALELIELALAARRLLQGKERGQILKRKAGQLSLLGMLKEQVAAIEEALELATEAEDDALIGSVKASMAAALRLTGRYSEAERVCREALELALRTGERKAEAKAMGELGVVSWMTGRYDEGYKHIERALEIAREIGDLP